MATKQEGGGSEVLPLRKEGGGGAEHVLAMVKGGGTKSCRVVFSLKF